MQKKNKSNVEISIVSPAYKCSDCLDELYARLILFLEKITDSFEIIFINDASPDDDWEVIKKIALKDKRVKALNLSRNFGQHYAINCDKIKNQLKWKQSVNFSTGLDLTIQWYLGNRSWVDSIESGDYRKWVEENYSNR